MKKTAGIPVLWEGGLFELEAEAWWPEEAPPGAVMFNLLQAIFDTASSASSAVGNSSGKVWYLKSKMQIKS